MRARLAFHLNRLSQLENPLCSRFNRASHFRSIRVLFRLVSRLGDGVFWYVMMAVVVAYYGLAGAGVALHMALTGLACTLVYKWIKRNTSRPRPFEINRNLFISTHPLDRYSFPSGHTLHAVAFAGILLHYYPWMEWFLLPFVVLVALSRLVLGLHYPSDVLAGVLIGTAIAGLSFLFV
jgi:undecaprenyl-diphosphatase